MHEGVKTVQSEKSLRFQTHCSAIVDAAAGEMR